MASEVDCVVTGRDVLGECPMWDERTQTFWWVDITGCRLKSLSGSRVREIETVEPVGSFAFRNRGGMLAAMKSGFYFLDPQSGERQLICHTDRQFPLNRLNDGRCDRAGRFWSGTMVPEHPRRPEGTLYRLSASLECTPLRSGITVPNSLAWSPDGRTMYFADTVQKKILAFDYDGATGTPTNERVFAETAGWPDGSCIDADGCLWNAEYGGWRLVRYTPRGKVDRTVALPVANPTCCCFGGQDLGTLYITTASQHLKPEQLREQPLAGAVLAVHPGIKGLPESRFAG